MVKFIVVKLESFYNAILGRPTLNTLRDVISTIHLAMKFLDNEMQAIKLKGDQMRAHDCYMESLKRKGTYKKEEIDYEPRANT